MAAIDSIDSEIVVDNDGDHGMVEETGRAYLQKGFHTFKLVYFNSSAGAGALRVWYAAPDGTKQVIPICIDVALNGQI